MLMVYLKLDHAIRPMQKRVERLFEVRRESYRVNQKNASYKLLHAFPAMIAARWADDIDYLSDCRAKQEKAKNGCDYRQNAFACEWMHMMRLHPIFPPFLPPLSPTTPITPL